MNIYLARPLDQARRTEWDGVVQPLMDEFHTIIEGIPDIRIFSPAHAFFGGGGHEYACSINEHAIRTANLIYAVLPSGVPTIGVPVEMMIAKQNDVPIIVRTDSSRVGDSMMIKHLKAVVIYQSNQILRAIASVTGACKHGSLMTFSKELLDSEIGV